MFVWRPFGVYGPGGSTTAPTVTQPPATTAANDPKPVTPNLRLARSQATSLSQLVQEFNLLAQKAEQAASENPNWVSRHLKQTITLSTLGATTDSAVPMLFANSIIQAVQLLVIEEITGLATLQVGDASDPDRFSAAAPAFAAGTGWLGLRHHSIGAQVQDADAALRLTGDAPATAGIVEVTVWFSQFRVPTLNTASAGVSTPPPPVSSSPGGLRWPRWLG